MKVVLTRFTPSPVMAIEEAAANCYDSTPNPNGEIMKACYRSGHYSVLEFADFTWHIEGVSRSLLCQITRHRVASFEVQSQRYVDKSSFTPVIPSHIKENPEALLIFQHHMDSCQAVYNRLIEDYGIPKEDARSVLPNACDTVLEIKMNLREFIHLCNERLCSRAQSEIRELVIEMVKTVNEATDNAFAYMLVPKCERNADYPFCPETKGSCGKHPKLKTIYKNEGEI